MGKNWVIQTKRESVIFVCALSIVTLVLSGCNSLGNGFAEVIDTDGDGWSDLQEERAGTNPNEPDTDGDGYWDPKDANPLDPNIPSITQPTPAPDETEAAETELSNIQTAVISMMVDNALSVRFSRSEHLSVAKGLGIANPTAILMTQMFEPTIGALNYMASI